MDIYLVATAEAARCCVGGLKCKRCRPAPTSSAGVRRLALSKAKSHRAARRALRVVLAKDGV